MRWVWDSEDIGGYFQVVQKIVRALKHAFATDFVVGAQVGEEVHHAHVSLVPRFTDDGHGDFLNSTIKRDFSADEMNQIADAIRQHLP